MISFQNIVGENAKRCLISPEFVFGVQRGAGGKADGICEGDSEVQASSYKINKSQGYNVRIENTVNNIVTSLYGDRWYWSSCSDHFIMYKNMEALGCTSETNIILYVNYNSIKNNSRKQCLLYSPCREPHSYFKDYFES